MAARNDIRYVHLHSFIIKGHKRSLKGHQRSKIRNITQRPDFLHVYLYYYKKIHSSFNFYTQGHWRSYEITEGKRKVV